MSLNNRQYEAIMREYDQKQLANKHALDLRKSEVYSCIPEIEALDRQLADNSISFGINAILNPSAASGNLEAENSIIIEKKARLLKEHGYPSDYLQLHYSCPLCKDTGYTDGQKCSCFTKALTALLYTDSNIKNALQDQNFDTFCFDFYSSKTDSNGVSPLSNIKKSVETVKKFIDTFDTNRGNLLIYGNTGVGKTFLCNCIARELINSGHSVIYQTAYELFDLLGKHKFSDDDDMADEKYACIFDCDLLIIDDLGAELSNSFTTSELYRIINERILRHKSVIISTNLSLDLIRDIYSERILSRIIKDYTLVRIFGEDIRFKKIRED